MCSEEDCSLNLCRHIAFGADSEQLAYRLYSDVKAILREGGFNLRKFVTNANELWKKIEKSESSLPCPESSGVSYTGNHSAIECW